LNKLSQNNDLKEKIELINQLKEIDNNLIYYDNILKNKGKYFNSNINFEFKIETKSANKYKEKPKIGKYKK